MAKRTPIEKLDIAIAEILKEYEDEIDKDIYEVTRKVAKQGAKTLNQASSVFKGNKYRKSWTSKEERSNSSTYYRAVIFSTMPGLPHLLENGHALRNGERYEGRTHIKPVEDEINELYFNGLIKKLEVTSK